MLKRILFFILIVSHVLINGVAASVHLTEDYQHEHHDNGTQLLLGDQHIMNDSCQHEQGDCAHMHPVYQLSEAVELGVSRTILSIIPSDIALLTINSSRPPIPPPIA